MACLRASLASFAALRSSASMERLLTGPSFDSGALHSGHRLAKPGLSGFSSNSSEQTVQTLMGKLIQSMITEVIIGLSEAFESTWSYRRSAGLW